MPFLHHPPYVCPPFITTHHPSLLYFYHPRPLCLPYLSTYHTFSPSSRNTQHYSLNTTCHSCRPLFITNQPSLQIPFFQYTLPCTQLLSLLLHPSPPSSPLPSSTLTHCTCNIHYPTTSHLYPLLMLSTTPMPPLFLNTHYA